MANIYTLLMNEYYVYILTNVHKTALYIGVTNNLERRILQLKQGVLAGFTHRYNCNVLVYFETVDSITTAIAREKQLKKWRRSKKEWLIETINPYRLDLYEYE